MSRVQTTSRVDMDWKDVARNRAKAKEVSETFCVRQNAVRLPRAKRRHRTFLCWQMAPEHSGTEPGPELCVLRKRVPICSKDHEEDVCPSRNAPPRYLVNFQRRWTEVDERKFYNGRIFFVQRIPAGKWGDAAGSNDLVEPQRKPNNPPNSDYHTHSHETVILRA